MKKLVFVLITILATAAMFSFGGVSAAESAIEAHEVVFERCEDDSQLIDYDLYNVVSDYVRQEGQSSFRCDTFWVSQVIQELRFGLELDAPVDVSGIEFSKAHLEFWIYVWDVDVFRHTVNSYLAFGSDLVNCYRYDLNNYPFEKGWNRISLSFAEDMTGTNAADFTQLTRFELHLQLERPCTAYIDEFIITDTPREVTQDQLGYRTHPAAVEYNPDAVAPDKSDFYSGEGWLVCVSVAAIALFCAGAAAVIVFAVLRRRGK